MKTHQTINLQNAIQSSTSIWKYQEIRVGLPDVHGYNVKSTKKFVYKGDQRSTKFRKAFSTNLELEATSKRNSAMEIEEQPTLSVNEQIEAAVAAGAAAAADEEVAYNLRPRPKLPNADDAAFLQINQGNTIIHAMELLQVPQIQPVYKSAFTCIRGDVDINRPIAPTEDEIIDVEVSTLAKKIETDWKDLHQSLIHTSPASPDERLPEEEEPTPGPALPPIKMKRRSAYTTDQEVEWIMKQQDGWNIVHPPAGKKQKQDLKRLQQGPFDLEDSLPVHLKELRRTLTRLRETARSARKYMDQVRQLTYDADLIQIGIQQLIGERMLETDSD